MPRTGPTTKDTTTVPLGLAQIRIGNSATYVGQIRPILASTDSIGALANTKLTLNQEFYKLESGYPLLEDAVFPLRESAMLECSFKELTPANLALAKGLDPSASEYSAAHTGSIGLGALATPQYVRMEAVYTFPDAVNTMTIIFPRAQVLSAPEVDFQMEEVAAVPITIEAKRADSGMSGGHVAWDDKPLGRIYWDDGQGTMTTTTSTSSTTTTS
jgi:hypothetical protein